MEETTSEQSASNSLAGNLTSNSSCIQNSDVLNKNPSNETAIYDTTKQEETTGGTDKCEIRDSHRVQPEDNLDRMQGEIKTEEHLPLSSCRHDGIEPRVSRQQTIRDYLEDLSAEEVEGFLLPDKLLTRFARIVDIVTPDDCNTRCFTKAYGHYVEGTGSMLQTNTSVMGTALLKNCDQNVEMITEDYLKKLRDLRIRYFTPREIANLHHFPHSFEFPDVLSCKQRYRVLGNSLNAHVVSVLLRYMVTE